MLIFIFIIICIYYAAHNIIIYARHKQAKSLVSNDENGMQSIIRNTSVFKYKYLKYLENL